MSADLLREAAALMRERAETCAPDATVGPVTWTSTFDGSDQTTFIHYQSWHPAVALAVADWLEASALRADEVEADGMTYGGTDGRPALAVARAYLGRTP